MSGVGQVVEAMSRTHGVAEAMIAEATSMRSQVESRVALLAVQAEATISRAVSKMAGQMQAMAAHAEESTSRVFGAVAQRWNKILEQLQQAPPRRVLGLRKG